MEKFAARAQQEAREGDTEAYNREIDAWEQAAVEYAATPSGEQAVQEWKREAEAAGHVRAEGRWDSILRRGASLRAANQETRQRLASSPATGDGIAVAGGPNAPGSRSVATPPSDPWAAIDAEEAARREAARQAREGDVDGDASAGSAAGGGPSSVKQYNLSWQQEQQFNDDHKRVSAAFAVEKGLWEGRRVAVGFLKERGSERRRTDMRVVYGTLVLSPNAPERTDQIGVRGPDGDVHVIHNSRARKVWDLTRDKAGVPVTGVSRRQGPRNSTGS